MSVFGINVTAALNNYKEILRKNLPLAEANAKIDRLQLRRRQIHDAQDVELFYKAQNVLADIKNVLEVKHGSGVAYIGVEDYMWHLRSILDCYQLVGGRVIHGAQSAACAIVEAIQLAAQPVEKINYVVSQKIHECLRTVISYGTAEQLEKFQKLLHRCMADHNSSLFEPMLHSLRQASEGEN